MSGSVPNFFSGLAQGAESGYDTISTGMYRKSIMDMRRLQAQSIKASSEKQARDTNAGVVGALSKPGGRLAPGQDLPNDTNAAAYLKGLPADQVAAAKANWLAQGGTEAQWNAYANSTTMNAAPMADSSQQTQDPDPFGMLAQTPAAPQQAKGGAVPRRYATGGSTDFGAAPSMTSYLQQMLSQQGTYSPYGQQPMPQQAKGGAIPAPRYAVGGTIDPDVTAAAGASNAQPQAVPAAAYTPRPGGAIPAPSAPMPQQAPAMAASAPPTGPGGAIPAPSAPAAQQTPAMGGSPARPMQPANALAATPAPAPPPPGGMAHPVPQGGVTPPQNIRAPQPIPPGALATAVPAQAALAHGQVAFGLHPSQNPQANPAQAKANYVELQHGAGAITNAQAQHLRIQTNGPDAAKNDPLGIQNASMLNNIYNYDLEHYGPQAAAADSFAVLQNYRINMQMYGGAAAASFETGNLPAAAHYLEQAYAFFPDGNNVKVTPGPNGSLVATRTNLDGKTIDTSTFATPDDLNKFIMQSSSFETYNNYVAGAQKAALNQLDVMNEISNRDKTTNLDAARTGAMLADTKDEIYDRDQTTADDNTRTKYTVSGGAGAGQKKPSAAEAAAYGSGVASTLNDPSSNIGEVTGYAKAAPDIQNKFVQLTTGIGMANSLDYATAANWAAHLVRNPNIYDPKTNTFTIGNHQYDAGNAGALLAGQGKATGGVISPAARAMADLPSD